MAKFPMDLSKFGKISASDKKTTLKHKDGHFMVISHKHIDGPTRKALDALPFASGGKVKKETYKEQPASKDPGKPRSGVRPADLYPEKYPQKQSNPKLEESKKLPALAEGGTVNEMSTPLQQEDHYAKLENLYAQKKELHPGDRRRHTALKQEINATIDKIKGKTPMADGGSVPEPDAKKAAEMQQGATESGFQPAKWAQNVKEGLGLAKGGEVKEEAAKDDVKDIDYNDLPPTTPDQVTIGELPPDRTEEAAPTPPSEPLTAEPVDPASPEAQNPNAQASSPQTEEPSTTASPAGAPQAAPEPTIGQQILQERNNAAQDAMAGNIHPKTYADLFADKSTPGKIGTIFGLLLSGMGSGLAHQPNALMAIMDKQLERDFEAQKADRSNQQNFYKIAQQQVLNDATVRRYAAENKISYAQAKKIEAEGGMEQFKLDQARALSPAEEKHADTLGRMYQDTATLHQLDQQGQKLPPGSPVRQAADTALVAYGQKKLMQDHPAAAQDVENAYNAEKGQFNDDPAMRPGSGNTPQTAPPPIIKVNYGAIQRRAKANNLGIPTDMSPSDVAAATKEAAEAEKANLALKEVNKAMADMWKNGGNIGVLSDVGVGHIGGVQLPNLSKLRLTPGGREEAKNYYQSAATIKKQVGNVLKGGLSPEVDEQIRENLPINTDTPEDYRKKLNTLNKIIIQQLDTGTLRRFPDVVSGLPNE